jgi:hypothetical protein
VNVKGNLGGFRKKGRESAREAAIRIGSGIG